MVMKTLDAALIQKCFLAGASNIEAKKEYINDLNVFPVPDGDTGTNMTMTIMSAAREVAALENPTMKELAKAISSGSLRGARGNSGVILSQLLRGFTKVIAEVEEVDVDTLAKAFEKAVESAYRAVMKPKEGTILTVARGGSEIAEKLAKDTEDLVEFADKVLTHMDEVLAQTPELLPVLKEAGVVDSGGEGLVTVLRGAQDALLGKEIDYSAVKPSKASPRMSSDAASDVDIKFGYCTEFIIMLEKDFSQKDEHEFKAYLESIGDSIVCVADDDIVKIHVHTNDPGLAIQKALTYGSLSRMKIDNMREEHNEKLIRDAEKLAAKQKEEEKQQQRKEVGFISVSAGDGLSEIFKGLGVDYVIEGGQTMNPSTEDILSAIDQVNADTIYILPNNGNIILASEQAKELTEDKTVVVIPSKNIPQGIAAVINFMAGSSVEENVEAMTEGMQYVKSGQVTYAVRDTAIDGKEIKQGNIMGLSDKTIEAVGTDVLGTTVDLVKQLLDEDSELVTLYYGEETSEDDASQIADEINKIDPELEVEVHYGGQPIYYYFISVE